MEVIDQDHDELPDGVYRWESVSNLPHTYYYGYSCVYNNEIHILGGQDHKTAHYKYDGIEWTEVSTLPYDFYRRCGVVYNNEIHILGGASAEHYKWNGTEWTEVSTLPHGANNASAVVYNNEIHILGGDGHLTGHYKWDGTEWMDVGTYLPFAVNESGVIVYNNEIHILGSNDNSDSNRYKHYKWNGTEWTEVSTLPYPFGWCSVTVYNNELHMLNEINYSDRKHYKWDGTEWTEVSTLPYDFYNGSAVVYNNEIHILGGQGNKQGHYKWSTKNNKAPLTFAAKNVLDEERPFNDKSMGWKVSYPATTLRAWLNDTFYESLPESCKSAIQAVKKYSDKETDNEIMSSTEKIWIPSEEETGHTGSYYRPGQGSPYSVFTDNASRIRTDSNGTAQVWHTRTAYTGNIDLNIRIDSKGALGADDEPSRTTDPASVLPCFCI